MALRKKGKRPPNPDPGNYIWVKTEEGGLPTTGYSVVYEIGKDYNSNCRLSLELPERPWIALLKINCIERNEPAAHPKLYGMTVIAVGDQVD